ncbi:MAG: hypothetical protein JSR42_03340 [Proteobacteria bacterium]|nr:hypothetical protein [Pseudomonadota bacterium]
MDECDVLFADRTAAADYEGAAAAVVAAISAIWSEGRNFAAFAAWVARADTLLRVTPGPHPVARAALTQHRLIAGLLSDTPLDTLIDDLPTLRKATDESRSAALRVLGAAIEGWLHVLSGDLHRAEECLRDAYPLASGSPRTSVPRLYLANCAAIIDAVGGTSTGARALLEQILDGAQCAAIPSGPAHFARANRLLLLARSASDREIEDAAEQLRYLVIPDGNRHVRSYMHFALGVAALMRGKAAEALGHARIAGELGEWCRSMVAQALPALLEAQALADLRQEGAALRCIELWLPRWQAAGYRLIRAAALLECANLDRRAGRVALARTRIAEARSALPPGAPLPDYHRPHGFAADLAASLLPIVVTSPTQPDAPPVRIRTFGNLLVEIGDIVIYDRNWRGNRTKTLLKALIVLGGHKVSVQRLCDLLWPDAEGDHAGQNLKVALSRLRHLGVADKETPLPWIVTQHGHISLVSGLCEVDCTMFALQLNNAESAPPDTLARALDLYQADFLSNDDSEHWIVNHRETLRRLYVRGSQHLARHCLLHGAGDPSAERHLERALDVAPHDLQSYELLMRLHLVAGARHRAEETCARAEAAARSLPHAVPARALQSLRALLAAS